MNGTPALIAVFALGLVFGYFLRGATRIAMSADDVAWGWGYKRRGRGRRRRSRVRDGVASPSVSAGIPPGDSATRPRSRLLFLAGLTAGALFATGYLVLRSDPEMLNWIGGSLFEKVQVLVTPTLWSS
jgi:hypothetical protein